MKNDKIPFRLTVAQLERILHDGGAETLAAMMVAKGEIFPPYISLLSHSQWHVRLGAMVTFEYLMEEDPELASQVIEPLWEAFGTVDESVQGDILYVLGETGMAGVLPKLGAVARGAYPKEVRQAALEAMGKIEKRNQKGGSR